MIEQSTVGPPSASRADVRRYGWALALFVVGLVVSLSAFGIGGVAESVGIMLYLAVYAGVVVADPRRFMRAISAHRWIGPGQGAGRGCVVALLYVFVVQYVVILYPYYGVYRYARGYLVQRKRAPIEQRRRIAELEAQLGIEPKVEGNCPNCGKPLQADAEFCGFCGKRVVPEVRVCAKCGTVSLPGAVWCARCGAALGERTAG